MFGTQAGDPDGIALQGPSQWFYFTDMAALFPVLYRFIKGVGTFLLYEIFQQAIIREIGLYGGLVFFIGAVPYGIGLGEQTTGIQCKDGNRELVAQDLVGDHLVLKTKTGRKGDMAREPLYQ